jgi:hypothetical protein
MTNNMKISLIKFKLARYYQLSLWILTHVSYVKKKTFKKDRKLHKRESCDRVKKIARCAEESKDLSMMKIIESDGFIERAVYHNGCVTIYLLKLKPAKANKNNDESVHDIARYFLYAVA